MTDRTMSCRPRPKSAPCFHVRHISYDGSDTLYASDDLSLSRLKLDDDTPPLTAATQRSPVAAEEPGARFLETLGTPMAADGTNPRHLEAPESPASASEAKQEETPGPFPCEWPKNWDQHPTTPGLLWIRRPWTDGSVEYLLHRPDLNETRTFWLPPGGGMFDFTRDPWTQTQMESMREERPCPPRSRRPATSPSATSDSSTETVLGELGSPCSRSTSTGAGLGIRGGGLESPSGNGSLREWIGDAERKAREDQKRRDIMWERELKSASSGRGEKRGRKGKGETKKNKKARYCLVAKNGRRDVYVVKVESLRR